MLRCFCCACLALVAVLPVVNANELEAYFEDEVSKLETACLADINSREDWLEKRDSYRKQLREMWGLPSWGRPERGDLRATVTRITEHDGFTVENLHFQALPGLYVTGNFYLPKKRDEKLPAILYVCGHARVVEDGVNFGNKARYRHHPTWFARNGYACLIIDTVQLGEIEGIHHGTYRENMWWWNSRGYSSASVEAWNAIRALDYLQSRPEVDGDRLGVTGRSGGGITSWWVGALDDRVKVAVPVAGITSLRNHVVDGCVEGHCDCMYHVNTYRWDFAQIAALMAPRPLLISNSDKDTIFPLDGIYEVHQKVKRVYDLLDAGDKLGLQITEGPHTDSQELRVHAFRWFNRFLKDDESLIREPAEARFEPSLVHVFHEGLPKDERTSTIHEDFVPAAIPEKGPFTEQAWKHLRGDWIGALRERVFRGWPVEGEASRLPGLVSLEVKGAQANLELIDEARWSEDPRRAHQLKRRFMLLGQTLDGMRVWDLVRQLETHPEITELHAHGRGAVIALYASLFTERLKVLALYALPTSHRETECPDFLNVSRYMDIPQVLAMAGQRCEIRLSKDSLPAFEVLRELELPVGKILP